jgi:S-layer homology domain
MKKKSTSQSAPAHGSPGEGAFLNLRVLFGLSVMLAGVLLALVSFGPATTGFAQETTREQMTLALAQALGFQPPACVPGQEMFNDVPASSPFCPFIEELSRRGITGGCGGGNFCPGDPVTRQQMAVFLVKGIFPEPFHIVGTAGEPAFQNGWTNTGLGKTTVGFYKDTANVVHLKGSMSGGASGTTAFTLPAGYRPSADLLMPGAHGGLTKLIDLVIQDDGAVAVFCEGGCTNSIGIDAISFRVGPGGA